MNLIVITVHLTVNYNYVRDNDKISFSFKIGIVNILLLNTETIKPSLKLKITYFSFNLLKLLVK